MFIFKCRCRSYCQCRDADAEISKWPFINLSVTTYFVKLLNGCFQTFKDKIFFACMSFFTTFPVVKILAKFGTTRKILMLVYYEVVGVWGFLWCLLTWMCVKLSLLLVRVLTTEFSPVIFIELLKLFCEVLTIIFRMHA